ncbi:hypothetical protein LTR97_011144 [Elasticomyces elasticus]|uniref:BTB domain-containing protein n=1 Tax=Elasticomyces elasticus TaxID=574655 RepID=A0AAN7VYR0_9PEZI|nr:hypothetical protein LTR97_011144 [Elasticomyces elasticus]
MPKASKRKRVAPDATEEAEGDDPQAANQAKRFRSSFADTMIILAGEDKVPFIVHTGTLRAKSEFLDAAFQREWLEGQSKTVNLPEVRPEIFELYATWSYFGRINIEALRLAMTMIAIKPAPPLPRDTPEQWNMWSRGILSLIQLYVAADFLGDVELKKGAIDGLTVIVEARRFLNGIKDLISIVWNSTPPRSGLRTFFMDYIISSSNKIHKRVATYEPDLPGEFFVDLAIHQLRRNRNSRISPQYKPLPSRKHMYYDGYESDE